MGVFSFHKLLCQICGKEFDTDFCSRGGYGRHRQCCCRACYDEYEYRSVRALLGKPYERMAEDYKRSIEKGRDRTMVSNMKIEKRTPKGAAVEQVVSADDAEFTLYHDPGEKKPDCFGLYIWELPFDAEEEIMKAAIEKITGCKVKSISFTAGNGHGEVKVKYE